MKIFKNKLPLIKKIDGIKNLSFIPTMGGLHEGHKDLIKKGKKLGKVIVSIYVNPNQFNSRIDFKNYPRQIKKDLIFLRKLNLIIKGFCIGSADVIPGVSGSTIAFILGIYPKLINAIKSFDSKWLSMIFSLNFKDGLQRPNFNFLIPLGVGILSAVFFFTRIIPLPILVRTHSEIIYGLFFGLVLGSIILFLYKLGTNVISKYFIFLLFGIFFGVYFISLASKDFVETRKMILLK